VSRGAEKRPLLKLEPSISPTCVTFTQREFDVQYINKLNFGMALVSGPGQGGASSNLPDELQLAVDAHVKYIQSLDTVRTFIYADVPSILMADTSTAKR